MILAKNIICTININVYCIRKDVWNNPIYSNVELRKRLNEGTYFTDVINPILRATLSGIYDGDNLYFTV